MPIISLINIHLHSDITIILFYLFLFSILFLIDLTYVPGGPYLLFLDSCRTFVSEDLTFDIDFI